MLYQALPLTMLVTISALNGAGYPALVPARVTCKQASSGEEAVRIWCEGYGRADGDSDGIPCENVCHSKEQVDEIRGRQGC